MAAENLNIQINRHNLGFAAISESEIGYKLTKMEALQFSIYLISVDQGSDYRA